MFHARDDWAGAIALHARNGSSFGRRSEPVTLTVDLMSSPLSPDWWRGVATLMLMCGTALSLAPGLEPVAGGRIAEEHDAHQAGALNIAPLASRSATGLRLVETAAVEPLTSAPERAQVDHYLTLGSGDSIGRLLLRAGADWADARSAEALARGSGSRPRPGTSVSVTLGARSAGTSRAVERVTLRGGLGETLVIRRGSTGLELIRRAVPIDTTPIRIRGRVGDGLYWSLRAAGVTSSAAAEYLFVIGRRIDVGGDVSPADRFDLVIANRRAANGESETGPLLYAGLDRAAASDLQIVRWTIGGRTDWFDANAGADQGASGMVWPVAAPITSGFGLRVHPILRFARMHRGVDFGAHSGAPVHAAADGLVSRAGWAGGYGRQVRLAHGGGIATSYSHLSQIVAGDGQLVRKGQLIGYVGSSGLSTGPHLHYEVYRGGIAVNPMSVRFTSGPALDERALGALKARVKALLSIGARRG
ncbi:MAG TPA: M23 family metallopeptidase [Sphingomicrobium sp.]|nr:M23 family metallopeptidase [Sphingomicrobium sp.]